MDIATLALTLAIVKNIPGSAAAEAIAAADRAEDAADLAQQYGYKFTIEDGVMIIGEDDE